MNVQEADGIIMTASGDPYGSPPDVASYIRYILKGQDFSTFLERACSEALIDVHTLMTAKVMDGSLRLAENEEGALLIAFCEKRIVERLNSKFGFSYKPFEV